MAFSRSEKITLLSLILTFMGVLAAWLVVPEFRKWVGLELSGSSTTNIQVPKESNFKVLAQSPGESTSAMNGVRSQNALNKEEFLVVVDSCTYLNSGNYIECIVKIINTKPKDRPLVIHSDETLAVNNMGIDHPPFSMQFGSEFAQYKPIRKMLSYNSPLSLRLNFDHKGDSQTFSLFRIALESGDKKFNVEFRDLVINKK